MNFYFFTILPLLYILNDITNVITTTAIFDPLFVGNETDRLALLDIKSKLKDPHGALNSWNESSNFCKWQGITCGRRHRRVTILDLSSNGLVGPLSPSVGNLSFLRSLYCYNNTFSGHIPPQVGSLYRLEILHMSNNSFQGEIPTNISGCSRLHLLRLDNNELTGTIPSGISFLSKLKHLGLSFNKLTGDDLSPLANLTSMQILALSLQTDKGGHGFYGGIPDFIGNFKELTVLALGDNSFAGKIPPSLYNLSNLQVLSLGGNLLEGLLPPDFGFHFPQLQLLEMDDNHFSGPIPISLSNLSKLETLKLQYNNFSGKILFDGRKIPNLVMIDFTIAIMGKGELDEVNFINKLVNCTHLEILEISYNDLGGTIPHSIANLSGHLRILGMESNLISGNIPSGLGNLLSLQLLGVGDNQLTGAIPSDIGMIPQLQRAYFDNNMLSGRIPMSLGNLSWLSVLNLAGNKFYGHVPATLGNCTNLLALMLSQNDMQGHVPQELFQISALNALYLDHNHLQGSLPLEIVELNLVELDMSYNNFSGNIPSNLGHCVSLTQLSLGNNSFVGSIPQSFSLLKDLHVLDLSGNKLSGQVPIYFSNFTSLTYLNLSFNNLEGEIPTKGVFANLSGVFLVGNKHLCGGIPQLKFPSCPKRALKGKKNTHALLIAVSISSVVLGLALLCSSYLFCKKQKREAASSEASSKDPFFKVSYDMLFKATNGFSPANLIGSGNFSFVYKGTILLGGVFKDVAIKVINNNNRGASKSFLAECEALRIIRHRNLVAIITACSSIDFQGNVFKALVYEFVSKGNLERWLHPNRENDEQFESLSLLQRLNIAIDVAHALDYIHNGNETPIIHCDLKPTNILLDEDLTAHVGDFGLVKLLPEITEQLYNSSSIGVRGTVGYAAPEYGLGTSVSTAGDVYSYGIILLEMMTAKKPTDRMFEGDMSLHMLAESTLPDRVLEILDPRLREVDNDEEEDITLNETRVIPNCAFECIKTMLMIGVKCSSEIPSDRMDMKDVVHQLQTQKDHLLFCRRRHRCQVL